MALAEKDSRQVTFPYFVDENDSTPPPQPRGKSPTDLVLDRGAPTRFDLSDTGQAFADALSETPFPAEAAEMVDLLRPRVQRWYEDWDVPDLEPWNVHNSR